MKAYPFRFLAASGLFRMIAPSFPHELISEQSPQVSSRLPAAHCLMGHMESQYGVFTPGILHPEQLIMSGVIATPFISDHFSATLLLSSLSSLTVAVRASQVSQFSPQ